MINAICQQPTVDGRLQIETNFKPILLISGKEAEILEFN